MRRLVRLLVSVATAGTLLAVAATTANASESAAPRLLRWMFGFGRLHLLQRSTGPT